MKKVVLTCLVGVGSCAVYADSMIDNFASGSYSVNLSGVGSADLNEQNGSMLSGHRDTQFDTVLNPYFQTESLQIDPSLGNGSNLAGAFVSGGVGATDLMVFAYGYLLNNQGNALLPDFLDADFTSFGGLGLNFLTNDQALRYTVLITSDNGTISSLGSGTIAASASSFSYQVAFNTLNNAPDLSDVDQIYIELDSSASGDYALSSITAKSTPEPASVGLLALGALAVLRRRRSR